MIRKRFGDGLLAVMPADHYIAPASGFRNTLSKALGLAASEKAIVVIGVTPTRPETGYGYQEIGVTIGGGYRVKRFVEKPSAASGEKDGRLEALPLECGNVRDDLRDP